MSRSVERSCRRIRQLARGHRSEGGATATEYALLMSFIALALFTGVSAFGVSADDWFARLAAAIAAALP